jgi:hypothetical protein
MTACPETNRAEWRLTPNASRLTCALVAAVLVLALTMACAKPPYDELQAAEKKVQEAETVGAPTYAPEKFGVLVAKLKTAEEEVWIQLKKSELRRDYSRAKSLLAETRAEGDQIIGEAQKRKEEAKSAALQEKEQAQEAVQGVHALAERVEQGKANPAGISPDQVKAEANELNRTLAEVQTAIEANNHLVAKDKAKEVQQKSQQLQTEVQRQPPERGGP